jgi:hypothetical protein
MISKFSRKLEAFRWTDLKYSVLLLTVICPSLFIVLFLPSFFYLLFSSFCPLFCSISTVFFQCFVLIYCFLYERVHPLAGVCTDLLRNTCRRFCMHGNRESGYALIPSRHRFFLVFLGPRANAGMVPVFPFQVATTCFPCSPPQLNLE